MRLFNLIKGDIQFQFKHGFYLIYSILTLLYIGVISIVSKSYKDIVATYIIFTDPVTAGLFFMGAIILFEKSQRVLNSLSVSPIKVSEYIISKVVSLSVIAIIVGIILMIVAGKTNTFTSLLGIVLGSILFTLISLVIAPKINSINQFVLFVIPIAIVCFIPTFYYLFFQENSWLLINPCNLILYLILGNTNVGYLLPIILLLAWICLFYLISYKCISKMFKEVGGAKI